MAAATKNSSQYTSNMNRVSTSRMSVSTWSCASITQHVPKARQPIKQQPERVNDQHPGQQQAGQRWTGRIRAEEEQRATEHGQGDDDGPHGSPRSGNSAAGHEHGARHTPDDRSATGDGEQDQGDGDQSGVHVYSTRAADVSETAAIFEMRAL